MISEENEEYTFKPDLRLIPPEILSGRCDTKTNNNLHIFYHFNFFLFYFFPKKIY